MKYVEARETIYASTFSPYSHSYPSDKTTTINGNRATAANDASYANVATDDDAADADGAIDDATTHANASDDGDVWGR